MEPITDVRQLTHIAYGFKASKAMLSAVELGIFGLLADGSKRLEELAADTAIAPNRLETLLTALVSLGLVGKVADGYSNAPVCETFLVPNRPAYMGDYLLLQTDRFIFPAFAELTSVLRGEGASSAWGEYQTLMTDADVAAEFSRGQHAGSLGPAAALAKQADLSGRTKLLDVGGGSGAFTIMLCRRNPHLHATILDFANALHTARELVTEAGLADRVEYAIGDALETDWPAAHDTVLMSFLFSAVSEAAVDQLLGRAFDALPDGGMVLVHDFMVDDDMTGPTDAALWFLTCMFNTADARVLTPGLISERMTAAGFVRVDVSPLIPDLSRLAVAYRPE